MIRANELMIGDYVLIKGVPRQVESITKKKVGYHIDKQKDNRLYYARLCEIEPIKIGSATYNPPFKRIVVNGDIELDCNAWDVRLEIEVTNNNVWSFLNLFNERLILRRNEVHLLQHIINNIS